jgi:hypothetical protein
MFTPALSQWYLYMTANVGATIQGIYTLASTAQRIEFCLVSLDRLNRCATSYWRLTGNGRWFSIE